jgi:hypothetical protein
LVFFDINKIYVLFRYFFQFSLYLVYTLWSFILHSHSHSFPAGGGGGTATAAPPAQASPPPPSGGRRGGGSLATREAKCWTGHRAAGSVTTGDACFPECQMHSGKGHKHSGKPSPSATLGEEPPGMPLTGKRSSPSVKNRTLGEAFPECRPNTRRRIDTVGAVRLFFKKKSSSPSATLGEEICFFFKKTLPRVQHSGKRFHFFKKILFPECMS